MQNLVFNCFKKFFTDFLLNGNYAKEIHLVVIITENIQQEALMNKYRKQIVFLLLIAAFIFLQIPKVMAEEVLNDPNLKSETLTWGKLERNYLSYIPSNLPKDKKVPLVICLHGFTSSAEETVEISDGIMNRLADRDGAIVLYPNATDKHWNDISGGYYEETRGVDDTGFVAFLTDKYINEYNVDPKRVYVTGFSNGGEMTLTLACRIPEKITAIACIISNMGVEMAEKYKNGKPLPILIMDGTGDPVVPWNGGKVEMGGKVMGNLLSNDDTVKFWVARNGAGKNCSEENLPDTHPEDGSTVIRKSHKNSKNGAEVILYEIVNGGHTVPGMKSDKPANDKNRINMDINGFEVIWNFFMRH